MSLATLSIFTILSASLTSATYNNAPTPIPLLASRSSVIFDNSINDATWPWHIYQTAPEAHPPVFEILWNGEALEPGSIALTPVNFAGTNATKDTAPLLMSSWGDLVWQGPNSGPLSPSLNGSYYLTYWNGYVLEGRNASIGYGNLTILDKHYEPAAVVCPNLGINVQAGIPHDCDIDYNEQYLTPLGTFLVTVYNLTQMDLSSVNGSAEGYLLDAQIHEIDIAASESIWKWSSMDHIPLNASQLPLTDMAANESVAWDYVHINSVSPYGTDKLLVSGRHTWDVFAIDRSSGDIVWNYNGIYGGDFGAVPEEATFLAIPYSRPRFRRKLHHILQLWQAGPGLNQTAFKWQTTFGAENDVATYRAQKASWYGELKTAPQLVVLQNGTAYMSWNGATHVAGWNIYSGSADNSTTYTLKGIARSRGFETAVDLGTGCYMV
ncbi:hypothetical protein BPAE_0068g00300 [Botrytis paeoniae]|uniref:Uncharacterized protein n=1 Tax=Botrytis paeoniae TaxID=278948 RepID=A0A4Z1FMZ6_9HELO|nr:hypothetical protein BPAE_0068g00300 [Botrytis paeoniae]